MMEKIKEHETSMSHRDTKDNENVTLSEAKGLKTEIFRFAQGNTPRLEEFSDENH